MNLKYSFTTHDRVFFVMEYVGGGELFEHIGTHRGTKKLSYFKYLHYIVMYF